MALNPAFEQQTTRKLPFCVGWNYLQGITVNQMFGIPNLPPISAGSLPAGAVLAPAQVNQYVLGDGEHDGPYCQTVSPTEPYSPVDNYVGGQPIFSDHTFLNGYTTYPLDNANRLMFFHYHGGSWATVGMPNNLISMGPDQATEAWLNYFPSTTPALSFSGIAYFFIQAGSISGTAPTLNPTGIYRTLRCRIFDASGDVIGYGFTTNPTWQMVETLLRFQIKPQQPGLAGLTIAEKALFDWPAIVAHAARNATILPNGNPTFAGNFTWAADASLNNMMEQQLRNCLSFRRIRGGQIQFVGEEQRASTFVVSQKNMFGGSLMLNEKDLTNVANVYIPQYRELGIPAVAQVATATTVAPGESTATSTPIGTSSYWTTLFTTVGPQPFAPGNIFCYGGSSDDADFAGLYGTLGMTVTVNGNVQVLVDTVANQIPAAGAPQKAATATGGFLGALQSRFQKYAPNGVQHRANQKAVGMVAPGIPAPPRVKPVVYDLGNNTFDQTNRIMKFLMARDLGTDGPGWFPPLAGTIKLFLEAIDVNGAAVAELEPGDVITIDPTADPTFAGTYEIVDPVKTYAPSAGDNTGSLVELALQTYNPNAYTTVSDPPGNSYQTVPGQTLPMGDILPEDTPFWLLQATPEASYNGSTGTVTVPDCTIMWMGQTAPTVYPVITLGGIPVGSAVCVFLNVTNQATTPTLSMLATTNPYFPPGSPETGPPTPLPYGKIVLFFGIFSDATTFSSGEYPGPSTHDSAQALPVISGYSTGLVFTPSVAYMPGTPITTGGTYPPAITPAIVE
jgi:hypothetical protein